MNNGKGNRSDVEENLRQFNAIYDKLMVVLQGVRERGAMIRVEVDQDKLERTNSYVEWEDD